jgi:hypothetical protein
MKTPGNCSIRGSNKLSPNARPNSRRLKIGKTIVELTGMEHTVSRYIADQIH